MRSTAYGGKGAYDGYEAPMRVRQASPTAVPTAGYR